MATITEDYCSFETAKLLKEKGFPQNTFRCHYIIDGNSHYKSFENRCGFGDSDIIAPTLAMAMKWLREIHNIHIAIIPCEVGPGVMDYTYALYKIDAKNFYFKDLGIQGRAENISKISYEKTCEAAIKCCLENLI